MALGTIKRKRSKVAKARMNATGHGNPGERKMQVKIRVWRASVPGTYVAVACLGSTENNARCAMGKRSKTPTGAVKNSLKKLSGKIR